MILDRYGNEYVSKPELRSLNLNNYLRFLTDTPSLKRITPEGSFSLSTVYSCIRILADAIAMTPFGLFRQTPGQPEIEQIFDGQLAQITRQASGLFNNFTFWQSMVASLNGWGNAFAVIIRGANRIPEQLIYLTPYMVSLQDTTDPRYRFLRGEVPYIYQVSTGLETFFVRPEDMVHLTLFTYDGLWGLSPIALHQDTMQVENQQTQYGKEFYTRGGKITGVIESPLKSTRDAAVEFVEWFNEFYGGQNSGQIAFLPNGLTFKQASVVNPQDAQWVEARKFTRQEIASIFRVPPYLLGDLERATWGNVSQLSEEFVRYSLQPIYTLIEIELNRKLLDNARTLYYQFDPSILLRGTTSERFSNYSIAITNGFMSRSEVRQKEGLPYEPELDAFMQMPGAAAVQDDSAQLGTEEDERSLTLPDPRWEELAAWRTQMTNVIQMNQNSIIQSGLLFRQQLEEWGSTYDRQIAERQERMDSRFEEQNASLAELTSSVDELSDLLISEISGVRATLEVRRQAIEACKNNLSEFIRIQKMRGTKHQDAIVDLRATLKELQEKLDGYRNQMEGRGVTGDWGADN